MHLTMDCSFLHGVYIESNPIHQSMDPFLSTFAFSSSSSSRSDRMASALPSPDTTSLFQMYDKNPVRQPASLRDPLSHVWTKSPMTSAYFSPANKQIIINAIRAGVYNKSNQQYVVAEPDPRILSGIMQDILIECVRQLPADPREQIVALNEQVVRHCVHDMYCEAQQRQKYLKDISTLVVPIAHPQPTQDYHSRNRANVMPSFF